MANRIVGNIYIIDSASGATTDLAWPSNLKCKSAAFWSSTTAGELILTMGGTNNQVIHFSFLTLLAASNTSVVPATQSLSFGDGVYFDALAVGTITAGTGFLYFG